MSELHEKSEDKTPYNNPNGNAAETDEMLLALIIAEDEHETERLDRLRCRDRDEEAQLELLQRHDRRDKHRLLLQQTKFATLFENHQREKDRHVLWMKQHSGSTNATPARRTKMMPIDPFDV